MKFSRFLVLCLVLLVSTVAFAQTTATLVGTATTDKAPLPGVTVTITSPNLQGSRTAVTGDNGGYSFPVLPPGDYKVKFELSGMAPVTKTQQVKLSETARVDADLKVSSITEAITVTASVPSVLETPQVASNLTLKEVERLPVARNQVATALLTPGVNDNTPSAAQFQISGSPGYDNLVLVNGVVVSENVRSQARPLYIEDAIQETTVMTGAISAEYGRFTGGVVNTVTKSGGNDLSGSLRDSLSSPRWSAQSPAGETRESSVSQVWEGTIGGYVLRDRLWFFTSGRWAKNDQSRQTTAIPPFNTNPVTAAGPVTSFAMENDQKRWEGKVTALLGEQQTVDASYFAI